MTTADDPETIPGESAAASAEAAAPSPVSAEQWEAAKKEAATNYELYLRAVADLDNFRRRMQREKEELRSFALSGVLGDLIPVLDNLTLSLAAARGQTEVKVVADGVAMVLEQLKQVLVRHGLKEVNPSGAAFDPNFHESISHQPSAEIAEGHVVQVVRTGYLLNGRLLRPASVVVSSGPAPKRAKG
jgi:molecular chaperone GrpE